MTETATSPGVAPVDLEAFAHHCWRAGSTTSLKTILDGLMPVSPFGHRYHLTEAVTEKMQDSIGAFDPALIDGQSVARLLEWQTFRNATSLDVRYAALKALSTQQPGAVTWATAAQLAALAGSCELGENAIAGAWGYANAYAAKYATAHSFSVPSVPTGLPVPADEIAMVLAGMNPYTRLAMYTDEWAEIAKTLNYTSGSMLLLSCIVSKGVLSEASSREHTKTVLSLVEHRHRPVVTMINRVFEGLIPE